MKRILATILAFVYLATSTGATINIHYCMGELVSHSLVKEDTCGKCGMEKTEEGCCEDVAKVIQTPQDDHSYQSANHTFTPFIAILQTNYIVVPSPVTFTALLQAAKNHSPPGSSGTSLYIRNCVFRI